MKIFSVFVILWGSLVTISPWLIESNINSGESLTYTIISGLGVLITASGFNMLRRSYALRQAQTLSVIPEASPDDSDAAEELSGGYPWSGV